MACAGARYAAGQNPGDYMSEGPLVAVVDDDMSIRNATQDLLRAAGYSTATFSNAMSFLDSPLCARIACLVADLRMPGKTGVELHEHLNLLGTGIPTVIITAHPGELTPRRASEAGIVCLLTKPFAPDDLLECVRKAIARPQPRRTIP
jgi:FixJ family two-component response regulator